MKRGLVLVVLFFVGAKVSAQNMPTDIFLFLGQSNMSGASPIGLLDTVTLDNVYLFNSNDEWEKAKNTLTQGTNRYSTVRTSTNTLSPAYTFTKKINAYTGKKIGIVSNARSATTISWWQKGYEGTDDNNLYEEAVLRAQAAVIATPGAKIKGILWLQGEGDNSSTSSKLYMERLQQLVSDLRTDLGDNTIPFIAGEVGKWEGRGLGVNPVIRSIKENIPYTDWVTTDGLMSKDLLNNDAHYDNMSQRTYGGRYADKALKLIYNYTLEGATVYSADNYNGRSLLLGEGDYSDTELESMGVKIDEIASAKIHPGYEIHFFLGSGDISLVLANDRSLLNNITAVSIKIIKKQDVFSGWKHGNSNYVYNFTGPRAPAYTNVFSLNGGPINGAIASLSDANTLGWLPAPLSGTAYILTHAHATYNGGYDLLPTNSPNSLKVRVTEGGPTKFSLMNVGGATEIARFATNIKFGPNGQKGTIRMAWGTTEGTGSSNAGVFIGTSNLSKDLAESRVFAALALEYSATGITLNGRRNKTGISTGTTDIGYSTIKSNAFSRDGSYELEVFMNNSAVEQTYVYGTNNINIGSRTYHVWINGGQLDLQGDVRFPTAINGVPELAIDEAINAFGISHLGGANIQEANLTFSNIRFDYAVSTLPISLTSFKAHKQNDAIKLNWVTLSEQGNSHFVILRSSNGKEFYSIAEMAGGGNSVVMRQYSYTDYNPFSGTNYYKLKQVDFDGTTTESKIKSVKADSKEKEFMVFKGEDEKFYALIYNDVSGNGRIGIVDILGRKLFESDVKLDTGYTKVQIPVSLLTGGVHIASLTKNGIIQNVKFIK